MGRNLGLPVGLLALLAVAFHVIEPPAGEKAALDGAKSGTSAGEKSGATSKPAEEQPEVLEGPWLASGTFFSSDATHVKGAVPTRSDFGINDGRDIEFLIACVPDPLHTRLALFTDSGIQAIESGAFAAGWEFATQWLPWYDNADPSEKDPNQRRIERAEVQDQEREPGLLVFRRAPKPGADGFDTRLLFVFIVGDTPTAGVNGYEFKKARAYMEAIGDRHDTKLIRIQGPVFSGSCYSLAQLIKEDNRDHPGHFYSVRTGTATAYDSGAAFQKETHAEFYGTNETQKEQQPRFCRVLEALHISKKQAAFLVEDETGFSHAFSQPFPQPSPLNKAKRNEAKSPLQDCLDIEVFRFPRDIANLRNAYREAVSAPQPANAPAPDVNFSLKDAESGEDSVPVFSATQTPLLQYAVVAQITAAIRRQRIRLLDLAATNVLDLMFLASVLRKQCPDTRLLIAFPDLLFVQEAASAPLTGTLALSTYPLFFGSNRWMGEGPSVFSSMNAEGVYNATVLLLAQAEPNKPPDPEIVSQLADYHWRGSALPPAWLLMLDRNGFSPVKTIADAEDGGWHQRIASQSKLPPRLPSPPRIWMMALTLWALVSLAFSGWIAYLYFQPRSHTLGVLAIEPGGARNFPQLFCLFLCLLTLATGPAVLSMPLLQSMDRIYWSVEVAGVLGLAGTIIPACLAILVVKRLWLPGRKRLLARLLAIGLSVLAFAASIAIWFWCCSRGTTRDGEGFFFSFRALELHAGSSPVIPVLAALAGLFLFSFFHMKRFYLARNERPRTFTSSLDSILQGRLTACRRDFNRRALAPLNARWQRQLKWAWSICAAAFLVFILAGVNENFTSVEGRPFDVLMIGLQFALFLALAGTCWLMIACWHSMRGFLSGLGSLPLGAAFRELGDGRGKTPIWARRLHLQSTDVPARSSIVLHNMCRLEIEGHAIPSLRPGSAREWFNTYRKALKRLLRDENQTIRTRAEVRHDFRQLRYVSASVAEEICSAVLRPEWAVRLLPWKPESDAALNGKEDVYDLAQGLVALHFSTYITYAVHQIQNLLWPLSLGFVLLTISLKSYSFQSPQLIGRFLILTLIVIGYFIWTCMSQMERNPILSRMTGTVAGELNKDFYVKLIGYGALPVLGVLASQFPSISNFLLSWVEPSLQAFR